MMDIWNYIEYGAWALSALFGLLIISDWIKIDSTYSEEVLTSSREGELEALTEQQHRG
jgi:exosortase/archaeosortase